MNEPNVSSGGVALPSDVVEAVASKASPLRDVGDPTISLAPDLERGVVTMDLGVEVRTLSLSPTQAREMANGLRYSANSIDGKRRPSSKKRKSR